MNQTVNASPPQNQCGGIIFRPVRNPVSGPRDLVAVTFVEFIGIGIHGGEHRMANQTHGSIFSLTKPRDLQPPGDEDVELPQPPAYPCTNATIESIIDDILQGRHALSTAHARCDDFLHIPNLPVPRLYTKN